MTLFIGDVHGKYQQYRTILRGCQRSIQVGDMGVGFRAMRGGELKDLANPPYDAMTEGGHRFIRGNHDNPAVCRRHTQWIPDGMVEDDRMFIGGATSIDKPWRIEGETWWPDEELSYEQLDRLVGVYSVVKPRLMVTHECPHWVAEAMGHRLFKLEDPSRTRDAFVRMHEIHQPAIWVFGHWHNSFDGELRGTRFICLNELETKEIE